jgi:hypothetical protein
MNNWLIVFSRGGRQGTGPPFRSVATNKWIRRLVLQEYAKSAAYVMRYGLVLL